VDEEVVELDEAAVELAEDADDRDEEETDEAPPAAEPDELAVVEPEEALTGAPPVPVPDDDATSTVLPHAEIVSTTPVTVATRAAEDFIAARSIVRGPATALGAVGARASSAGGGASKGSGSLRRSGGEPGFSVPARDPGEPLPSFSGARGRRHISAAGVTADDGRRPRLPTRDLPHPGPPAARPGPPCVWSPFIRSRLVWGRCEDGLVCRSARHVLLVLKRRM